jgi:hypothetical protein
VPDISSGLTIGLIWLAREIAGLSLQRIAARSGRLGYVEESTILVERVTGAEGYEERTFVFGHDQGQAPAATQTPPPVATSKSPTY